MHTQPTLLVRPQRRRKRKSKALSIPETSRYTKVAQSAISNVPPLCDVAREARAPTPRSGSRGQARLRDRPSTVEGMAVKLLARPQVRPTNGIHTGATHTGATAVQRMLARPHPPRKAREQASALGPGKAGLGAAPRLK
eukprot:3160343-Amphidinium_carterae.1